MNINELEALLNELFVENTKTCYQQGRHYHVSPLNFDFFTSLKKVNAKHDKLSELLDAIDRDAGISEITYDKFMELIIPFVNNEILFQKAPDGFISYFHEKGKLVVEYAEGKACTFRQVYQHYDNDQTKTLEITPERVIENLRDDLEKIRSDVVKFRLTEAEYLEKIEKVNAECKELLEFKIVDRGHGFEVIAYFKESPEELAQRFKCLADSNGIYGNVMDYGADKGFNILGNTVDLFVAKSLDYNLKGLETGTIIIPSVVTESFNKLISMYLSSQIQSTPTNP